MDPRAAYRTRPCSSPSKGAGVTLLLSVHISGYVRLRKTCSIGPCVCRLCRRASSTVWCAPILLILAVVDLVDPGTKTQVTTSFLRHALPPSRRDPVTSIRVPIMRAAPWEMLLSAPFLSRNCLARRYSSHLFLHRSVSRLPP